MKRECGTCVRNKLTYCPSSIDCLATDDKPYYQNRIMLLEENWKLKKQLEEKENQQEEFIESLVNEIKEHEKYDKKNNCEWQGYNFYQDVLLKHKEIIGGKE